MGCWFFLKNVDVGLEAEDRCDCLYLPLEEGHGRCERKADDVASVAQELQTSQAFCIWDSSRFKPQMLRNSSSLYLAEISPDINLTSLFVPRGAVACDPRHKQRESLVKSIA